jgi:hypothetical protein
MIAFMIVIGFSWEFSFSTGGSLSLPGICTELPSRRYLSHRPTKITWSRNSSRHFGTAIPREPIVAGKNADHRKAVVKGLRTPFDGIAPGGMFLKIVKFVATAIAEKFAILRIRRVENSPTLIAMVLVKPRRWQRRPSSPKRGKHFRSR